MRKNPERLSVRGLVRVSGLRALGSALLLSATIGATCLLASPARADSFFNSVSVPTTLRPEQETFLQLLTDRNAFHHFAIIGMTQRDARGLGPTQFLRQRLAKKPKDKWRRFDVGLSEIHASMRGAKGRPDLARSGSRHITRSVKGSRDPAMLFVAGISLAQADYVLSPRGSGPRPLNARRREVVRLLNAACAENRKKPVAGFGDAFGSALIYLIVGGAYRDFKPTGGCGARVALPAAPPIKIERYPDGAKRAEWRYRAGRLHGKQRKWYDDGKLAYVAEYKDGRAEGLEKRFYASGKIQERGRNAAGRRTGLWRSWFESGQKQSEAQHEKGLREGSFKLWYANGKLQERSEYLRGRKHGTSLRFHDNGKRFKEDHFVRGKRQGRSREWLPSGRLRLDATYRGDRVHGQMRQWHDSGTRLVEAGYSSGQLEGDYRQWWRNGRLKLSGKYRSARRVGSWRENHMSGKAKMRGSYDNQGRKHGAFSFWHKNGQLAAQGNYAAGKKAPGWRYFRRDGTPSPRPVPVR